MCSALVPAFPSQGMYSYIPQASILTPYVNYGDNLNLGIISAAPQNYITTALSQS